MRRGMMVVGSWLAVGSSLRLTASFFQGRWDSPVPLRVLEWPGERQKADGGGGGGGGTSGGACACGW